VLQGRKIFGSCGRQWPDVDRAIGRVVLRAAADPELLAPMFTEIHIWRAREADFEVGGRRQGVFAHDWRAEPAPDWFRLKAERAGRIPPLPPAAG